MFNPRDDNYCCICKSSFKSYWEHLNGKGHIKRIKSNKTNNYIHELCRKLNEKEVREFSDLSESGPTIDKKKKIFKRAKKIKKVKEEEVFTR